MGHRNDPNDMYSGVILKKEKIAEHTFHLKVQSSDFAQMNYVPGFTADVYVGNPYDNPFCEHRKYSFWNYDPVYHTADFALCTFSNGKGARWIQSAQVGEPVYFNQPQGKLLVDNTADNYLLIGDVTSLSHLYELHRGITISKNVRSFIYTECNDDLFADIDQSFPLDCHVISAKSVTENVKQILLLSENVENTIVYNFGDPGVCMAIHAAFKNEYHVPLKNLRTKPFWK
ncbi:hypothetical protein BLX24_28800 [Arsenicibacter rosenii]|uniref:FAD-binding FR-type domain-containing protein n=2 Tax=Arsenicibacter rosenii TaxID=1750698 RepID=A0A1S2VB85_9BACT|nr:hypothetical protein BLX24_28800 [Arsenicibacter rosenii]